MLFFSKLKSVFSRRQKSISSASLVLAITFGLSAIMGFLRSRFLYAQFFSCCAVELDAYNAAFRLPDLVFKLLVTGALSASFIPVFSSYFHKKPKEAYYLASSVVNILLGLFLVISLVIFVFARPFSEIIASGFSSYQIDLMVKMTRILLLAQMFFLLSNFITGTLHVQQMFLIPSLSPLVYNFFIILSIFTLVPTFGIYGPVYGAVVGAFFHLAIQIPIARRLGFRYQLVASRHHPGVREVFRLMVPRSLSLGLGEIENTVTLFFASSLTSGSISLLNLAMQLMYLPSRIFGTTVGQASLPILSKNVAKNQLKTFRETVKSTVIRSLFFALPITALILVNRVAIVRLAFGAKQFPWTATLLTAKTLAFLTPAIFAQAITQILVRSFYALHDTKTPLKISAFSLIINIATSFYFINYTTLGIVGLAISASLSNLIQAFGLCLFFINRVNGGSWSVVFIKIGKIALASFFAGFISWFSLQFFDAFVLDTTKTISVATIFSICLLTGSLGYLFFAWMFRVQELQLLKKIFRRF